MKVISEAEQVLKDAQKFSRRRNGRNPEQRSKQSIEYVTGTLLSLKSILSLSRKWGIVLTQ